MTEDKVHPTTKLSANGATAAPTATSGGAKPTFPPNKAQLYNARRPMYRPQPPSRRRRRSCKCSCCRCCLWTTFIIITVLLILAVAGGVFWVLYRPQKPSFSVSALQLSQFNLTATTVLSKFSLTVTARNPNDKITFLYNPISISISSDDVDIGDGSYRGFVHGAKNTTVLKTVVSSSGDQPVDGSDISTLRSRLRSRKGLTLKIEMNAKVKVKFGSLKSNKLSIVVTCNGLQVAVPTGKSAAMATATGVKCKVDPRLKILNWTF